ncbi:hypothetical protein FVB9288_00114 [Flavobacterium sp. CECT 9288]|uniref:hypothetical protein n=1 Tax=Flavobacterium sp. CECT 9288 TaxID=2845819 RepID=UPI001E389D54|nr:hypothetical protein [Flavobacterium sp. CECT 9288]CAH0334528.1 hypothetical protein FVB9288_00114 [Flavobacterium sp. CECT 9288]
MKKIAVILLCIFCLVVFAVVKTTSTAATITLDTSQKKFTAGTPILLQFSSLKAVKNADLFLIHSYGKTIVKGKVNKNKLRFSIPELYAKKTGTVSWYLIQDRKNIAAGQFEIVPNDVTPTLIENYLGPTTILTGQDHYTMMVAIPTDSYDNPKTDNTTVFIKDQFLDDITVTTKKTADFIAWKNIYSRTVSGKMLISTQCNTALSKEFETDITPSIATNFTIDYARNHQFADGNQITKLRTSVIKDQFGNLVGDGTLVTFQVTTKNNNFLKTFAATINGVAIAQLLHPDHKEIYTVKAYVTGMAESKPIQIAYQALIKDFPYQFLEKNRKIVVGPLTSFMNQIVPDGIKVELKIFHKNKLIETKIVESAKGLATFILLPPFYKQSAYQFEITTLGVTKKTETIPYENYQ